MALDPSAVGPVGIEPTTFGLKDCRDPSQPVSARVLSCVRTREFGMDRRVSCPPVSSGFLAGVCRFVCTVTACDAALETELPKRLLWAVLALAHRQQDYGLRIAHVAVACARSRSLPSVKRASANPRRRPDLIRVPVLTNVPASALIARTKLVVRATVA